MAAASIRLGKYDVGLTTSDGLIKRTDEEWTPLDSHEVHKVLWSQLVSEKLLSEADEQKFKDKGRATGFTRRMPVVLLGHRMSLRLDGAFQAQGQRLGMRILMQLLASHLYNQLPTGVQLDIGTFGLRADGCTEMLQEEGWKEVTEREAQVVLWALAGVDEVIQEAWTSGGSEISTVMFEGATGFDELGNPLLDGQDVRATWLLSHYVRRHAERLPEPLMHPWTPGDPNFTYSCAIHTRAGRAVKFRRSRIGFFIEQEGPADSWKSKPLPGANDLRDASEFLAFLRFLAGESGCCPEEPRCQLEEPETDVFLSDSEEESAEFKTGFKVDAQGQITKRQNNGSWYVVKDPPSSLIQESMSVRKGLASRAPLPDIRLIESSKKAYGPAGTYANLEESDSLPAVWVLVSKSNPVTEPGGPRRVQCPNARMDIRNGVMYIETEASPGQLFRVSDSVLSPNARMDIRNGVMHIETEASAGQLSATGVLSPVNRGSSNSVMSP
jgi:hypothetical protein